MLVALDVPPVRWDGRGPRDEDHDLYGQQHQEAAHGVGVGLPRGHRQRSEQDHRIVEPRINPDPSRIEVDHLIEACLEVTSGRPRATLSPEIKLIPTDDQDSRDEKLKCLVEQYHQNLLLRELRCGAAYKFHECSAQLGSAPTALLLRA